MSAPRNAFSPREAVTANVTVGAVSMTKQSMKDESDINFIIRRYVKTGNLSHVNRFSGMYGDFTPLTFHEAMNIVRQGEEMFEALPAVIRRRFGNDPEAFLGYVQDPKNLPEMRELGLANPLPQVPGAPEAEGATLPPEKPEPTAEAVSEGEKRRSRGHRGPPSREELGDD